MLESIKVYLDYPSAVMSKLELAQTRRVLVQEHTAGQWGAWDLNPRLHSLPIPSYLLYALIKPSNVQATGGS